MKRLVLRTVASAVMAFFAPLAHAQCLDWADGFAADELGTDYLIRVFYPIEEDGQQVLYAGGGFSYIGGVEANGIARWNGASWEPLGPGVDGTVHDIVSFDDGSGPALYVAGSFYHAGGLPIRFIARWRDGEWSDPGADLGYFAYALAVHDSRLFVAGDFNNMLGGLPVERLAAWDGSVWERFLGGPKARKGHAIMYDAAHDYVLLFGGDEENGIEQQDTWSYDESGWTRLAIGGPEPRDGQSMAYDSLRQRVLMFGGEPRGWGSADSRLWTWDGTSWAVVADFMPVARFEVSITYDARRDRVVWFGGREGSSNYFDDTWEFDGSQWAEVIPATTRPPARTLYALAYDAARQRVVMFGGNGYSAGTLGDTWEWDGADWVLMANGGPSPRYDCAMAYDSLRQQVVLYGGRNGGDYYTDTWGWNGSTWTLLAPPDPNRLYESDGPVTYDPARDRVVLRDKRGVTWLWDGAAWDDVNEGGLNQTVYDLASFDAGWGPELYACGYFTKAGSISAARIARLTQEGWQPVGGGIQDTYCYKLYEWDDGGGPDLYIGGSFNMADNQPMQSIGRWDGLAWSILNVGDSADGGGVVGAVHTIFAYDDGSGEKLYVGGNFDLVDGPGEGYDGDIEARNVARWDRTVWEPVGGHIDPQGSERGVYALGAASIGGGQRLLAGGRFDTAGGKPSSNLALWGDPCTAPTIVEQPEDVIAIELEPVIFTTRAWGTRPLSFQWRKDGVDLVNDGRVTGATTDLLYIEPWLEADAGIYDVVVTNAHGSDVSDPAGLTTFPGGGSGGIVSISSVFMPGDELPWSPGEYFSDACCPSMSSDTTTIAMARIHEVSPEQALVVWQDGELRAAARQGEQAPGVEPGLVFAWRLSPFQGWLGTGNGGAFFHGVLEGSGVNVENRDAMWYSDPTETVLVARAGDQAGQMPPGTVYERHQIFSYPLASQTQHLAFFSRINGGGFDYNYDWGWWRWHKSTGAELLIRTRMPAPGLGPNVRSFENHVVLDNLGLAFISGSIESNTGYKNGPPYDWVLWYGAPGALDPVVMSGDPAPGFDPDVNIEGINVPVLGSDGQALFLATVAGPGGFGSRAAYGWAGGELTAVLRKGDEAPGVYPASTFSSPNPIAANGAGSIVVWSNLATDCDDPCPSEGMWRWKDGSLELIVSNRADPIPGAPAGFTVSSFGPAGINDEEEMIFNLVLSYGGLYNCIYGWLPNKGLFPIVVPGSQLELAPGDTRVATGAFLAGPDGNTTRLADNYALNEEGRFSMQISFSDGTRGNFVGWFEDFERSFFPCIPDFNGDDVVDTRDVLVFLNAWVAGDAAADIDGNGVIDTRDVLAFLNLWTAGC